MSNVKRHRGIMDVVILKPSGVVKSKPVGYFEQRNASLVRRSRDVPPLVKLNRHNVINTLIFYYTKKALLLGNHSEKLYNYKTQFLRHGTIRFAFSPTQRGRDHSAPKPDSE